ncbi:MAG: gliding motility-associated C-terminal domain-containing protein, partial [Bacteroidia bacterium]|nr:gliding motility-associated C-terminal domain-containing protein [Bacteroidia bacterium]
NNTFISEGAFSNRLFYGDGSPFQDVLNGSKKYTKDSTYLVRVISYSDKNCTDTASRTVTVFPKAKTAFNIDNIQKCLLGNSFNFNSTTTLKYGTFVTNWQFGDGSILNNSASASHSYLNVQQYNVKLISQTNEGCMDTLTKQVRTLPMPVADFTFNYNKSCIKGNDFQFNSTTVVSNGTPMSHNWYFGDGDSAINTTFTTNTYANPGQYTVRMISSTNIGLCKDTIDKVMDVFPMPIASFSIDDNRQCFQGNNFNFSNSSNISTGTIDQNDWTFGDGSTSLNISPSKSYIKVDSFWVRLKVTSDNGCTDTIRQRVWVDPMPVSKFTVGPLLARCLIGNVFKISNKATIGNGGAISQYSYYYDFDNYPNSDSSNLASPPDYSYTNNGDYNIVQKTITNRGCWDTSMVKVTVNANPDLSFYIDSVCFRDSSYFINTSVITDSITYWKWIFGDGRVSTLKSPTHRYRNVGNYDVKLIAGTKFNCIDTLEILSAAKVNPIPKAGFYFVKERSWENEVDIQYYDTSVGATKWSWNFSQMGNSTDQNPKLFYVDTLTQVTSLVAINDFGCTDTITKVLFIAPDVIYYMASAFTPNDDNINETFKPVGLAFAVDYKFIILNRWGDILFQTDNPQLGWNGLYMNELVEQGLYFYRLEFVGADELRHEEKGSVMILR